MVSTARQRPWRIALVASLALARAACPPPERVSAAVDALLAAPVERECAEPTAQPYLRDLFGLAVVLEPESVAIERGAGGPRGATTVVVARALACPTDARADATPRPPLNASLLAELGLYARVVGAGVAAADADVRLVIARARGAEPAAAAWDVRVRTPFDAAALRGSTLELVVATRGGRVDPAPASARREEPGRLWRADRAARAEIDWQADVFPYGSKQVA